MNNYDDIINLPHYESATRQRMSMHDRAAQFSPFAALTGHSDAIDETARYTEKAPELDENAKAILNEKLLLICENIPSSQTVTVTYFSPDEKKDGGSYITKCGTVRNIDTFRRELVFSDMTKISVDCITDIDCQGIIIK